MGILFSHIFYDKILWYNFNRETAVAFEDYTIKYIYEANFSAFVFIVRFTKIHGKGRE
ncbi:hypothetical protein [Bartonella machadoae]|uniref:hypothetical protein n=1 Tax=Bartonella machadoae TaxID=2893471 RepID=UPI001F4CF8B4|nr:hypothetical protein [Bartonella machadoae]UNE54600.1 hypothetical protein LNM86_01470 [Bartonella machadoae]